MNIAIWLTIEKLHLSWHTIVAAGTVQQTVEEYAKRFGCTLGDCTVTIAYIK